MISCRCSASRRIRILNIIGKHNIEIFQTSRAIGHRSCCFLNRKVQTKHVHAIDISLKIKWFQIYETLSLTGTTYYTTLLSRVMRSDEVPPPNNFTLDRKCKHLSLRWMQYARWHDISIQYVSCRNKTSSRPVSQRRLVYHLVRVKIPIAQEDSFTSWLEQDSHCWISLLVINTNSSKTQILRTIRLRWYNPNVHPCIEIQVNGQ